MINLLNTKYDKYTIISLYLRIIFGVAVQYRYYHKIIKLSNVTAVFK